MKEPNSKKHYTQKSPSSAFLTHQNRDFSGFQDFNTTFSFFSPIQPSLALGYGDKICILSYVEESV